MTPDQSFARWVRVSLIAFAVTFVYYLLADLWMPMTPQSRVLHPVTAIAPQVSGMVTDVQVRNNQHVEAGDLLFVIDDQPYRLAVEQARLALQDARQINNQLDAAIVAAKANVSAAKADAQEAAREAKRLKILSERQSVSIQQYDQAKARHQSAAAQVAAAQAEVLKLEAERGAAGDKNVREAQAANALAQAELNLAYTQVRARSAGFVSNLQVRAGTYASAGKELAALVVDEMDIVADFREKSLNMMEQGGRAEIVFDAYPGQVFSGVVTERDAGTLAGQIVADGRLAAPEATDRWVRDAQRQRVHLELTEEQAPALPTGSRATVQLFPVGGVASWLGQLQIRIVSLMHYIY